MNIDLLTSHDKKSGRDEKIESVGLVDSRMSNALTALRRPRYRCTLILGALAFVLACPLWLSAQAVGQIWGVVRDPSGAVIPHANITAVEQSTGLRYTTVTTGAGNYSLTRLPIGTYTLTGKASGFQVGSATGITLEVNQQREVDFTLTVGASTQRVTVSAAPPLLNTSNGTLGGVISGQQVETLPLNGRDITRLIELQPGTARDPNGPGVHNLTGSAGFVSSNGTRGTTAAMYLDGMDASDTEYGGGTMTNFNLDAVSEFRVIQNNYSAEYGRGGGMVILVASKAGTNQFHGSAFEFLRNSALDARSFFASGVPPLQRNEFGGTIGGPIIKHNTFFFFQYAGLRQLSGSPNFYLFPTAQNRQGIVDITGTNGTPDQLLVPLVPAAKTALSAYPLPNDPTGPYGANTYLSALKTPVDSDQYSARIDHRFSDKDSIFGRFTYDNITKPYIDLEQMTINPAWSGGFRFDPRNVAVSETHTFTPTLVNTLSLSWMRVAQARTSSNVRNLVDLQTNDGSLAGFGPLVGGWSATPDSGNVHDAIHWVKGRNMISMGVDYRNTHATQTGYSIGAGSGRYTFAKGTTLPVSIPSASGLNDFAAGSPSPSGLVSLMVGAPRQYAQAFSFPGLGSALGGGGAVYQLRYWNAAGFFQDDITITPKITLNLGLRYEFNSVPMEEHNKFVGIVDDPNLLGGSIYRSMVLNPNPLYQPDYNGWGPRFGLAYRLNNKTVFRGGFGIYTLDPRGQNAQQAGAVFPWASSSSVSVSQFQLTPLNLIHPPALTSLSGTVLPPNNNTNLIPPNTPLDLGSVLAFFGAPVQLNTVSMTLRNGYGINGNATVERQLPGDMAMSIAYVASNGVALPGDEFPNAYDGALPQYTPYTNAYPGIGEFQLYDNHEHSTYNALQVAVRKTSTKYGLAFQASYTYSKELDNGSAEHNSGSNSVRAQQNPFCWSCDKGPGSFDFPQNFVMDFIYRLPLENWRTFSHLPSRLVQGWQVAGIPSIISGAPFTVTSPYSIAAFGTDTYYGDNETRPDMVGKATLNSPSNYNSSLMYFSPSVVQDGTTLGQQVFATPGGVATGSQSHPGNLGRNTFRAPLQTNIDFSIMKDTKITESSMVQFRAEFFNIFNLHSFGTPGATLGTSDFGQFSSSSSGRIIQFGLRVVF